MCQSCLENDEEITELLIDAGCDIDSLDNELWTPLHAAVSLANYECVQLLLKNNAKLVRIFNSPRCRCRYFETIRRIIPIKCILKFDMK